MTASLDTAPHAPPVPDRGLVDLLGDTRARVVQALADEAASVTDLAARLGLSAVAIRRHLQILERDGLVTATTVRRQGPGRPGSRYALSARARRLFPDRSADLANELLDFLAAEHGRSEMLRFLRWRTERQAAHYAEGLEGAGDDLVQRTEALAGMLSAEGFDSSVQAATAPDGATTLQLTQAHCAIAEVAAAHPELCAFEASTFRRLLGAKLSRRQTIAGGATACVCHIAPDHS